MKVVLDTNVLVSGIFFRGAPGQIIDHWIHKKFSVYASPAILAEYLRVIEALAPKGNAEIPQRWNSLLPKLCHVLADPDKKQAISFSRDSNDDKFIWCAFRAKVDCLVTGDEDLKVLSGTFPFKIASPREFLRLLD